VYPDFFVAPFSIADTRVVTLAPRQRAVEAIGELAHAKWDKCVFGERNANGVVAVDPRREFVAKGKRTKILSLRLLASA
jgi:hypothetical protein